MQLNTSISLEYSIIYILIVLNQYLIVCYQIFSYKSLISFKFTNKLISLLFIIIFWLRMTSQFKSLQPECIYGKTGIIVCTNPNCKKPGFICENGYNKKQECYLFHENCTKIKWSEIEEQICNNPHLRSLDFVLLRDKMDNMFVNLIEKIQTEHAKFKIWVKTYGYGLEFMKFVKNINERNYTQINGNCMHTIGNQILSAKFKETPIIIQNEIVTLQEKVYQILDRTSDLYLKPGTKYQKSSSTQAITHEIRHTNSPVLHSKIIHDVNNIYKLFDSKITSLKLIYRASENGFSTKEFHKKCDGQGGTLTILQTQFGKIIGGYTPVVWSSAKKQWAADKALKSFIFSLNMKEKFTLNLAQFAIANNPDKGPIFGCCDICIVDNANKERSNAEFPISYNNSKYIRCPQSSLSFTGHPKGQFLIKEWETFKIEFQ